MKYYVCCLIITVFFSQINLAQTPKQVWASCGQDSASGLVLTDMVADTVGNTYYTGYTTDSSYYANHHFFITKINKSGIFEWTNNYPLATKDTFETGNTITIDKKGFIYVAGELQDSFCNICTQSVKVRDQFVIKYSSAGNVVWINRLNGTKNFNQSPTDIIATDNGNVFVTGTESVYNPLIYEYTSQGYLHRIGPNGNTSFIRRIKDVQPKTIAIDNNSNVIFGGRKLRQNLYQLAQIFIAKYSFRGDSIWTAIFNENNKNSEAVYLQTDAANNIYVLGQTDTIAFYNNPRAILQKYNAAGTLLWHYKEPDRTYCRSSTTGLQLDAKGNIYTATYVDNKFTTNEDWCISKFTTSGTKRWTYTYDDSLNGNNYPAGIALDDRANVLVTGLSGKRFNPYMYGTLQLDSSGKKVWFKQYTSLARGNNFAIGISAIGKTVIVGGYTSKGLCAVKYDYANIVQPRNVQFEKAIREKNSIVVYPNPTTNFIQLNIPKDISYESISIINNYGMVVKQISNHQLNGVVNISTNNLNKGVYFVNLQTNDGLKYVAEFVKQ